MSTQSITAPIERILRIIGASQSLTDAVPISAMLIAAPDSGKSGLLLRNLPHGARILDDLTTASLVQVLTGSKDVPCPKVLVLPDLNMAVSHKPTVAALLMSCLLPLMGEGLTEIPGVDPRDGAKLQALALATEGIRVAVLTAVTYETFSSRRGKWRATGFLRRLAPIYYGYKPETVDTIQSAIAKQKSTLGAYPRIFLPEIKGGSPTIPPAVARELESMSRRVISEQLVWRHRDGEGREHTIRATDLPFSAHKTLRTYCRAAALVYRRTVCTSADLDLTFEFARFLRYDEPELL